MLVLNIEIHLVQISTNIINVHRYRLNYLDRYSEKDKNIYTLSFHTHFYELTG